MIIHFPAASNDWWVHVWIKSSLCLLVCVSEFLVDPIVFPVLSRQQADEAAGSSERKTLQHLSACLYVSECVWVCVRVCGHRRRTKVPSIERTRKVPGFKGGLLLCIFPQTAGSIHRRGEMETSNHNNNNNNFHVNIGSSVGSKKHVEGTGSSFLRLFSFYAFLCLQSCLHEATRARCHPDPLENSDMVGAENRGGRGWKEGCKEEERWVKGAWRLPLIWHINGSHVMTASVQQIGFEGGQTGKWGIQLALCQQPSPVRSALTLVAVYA